MSQGCFADDGPVGGVPVKGIAHSFVMLNLFVRCTPLAPASYFLQTVGIKILKQVQDDGAVLAQIF